MAALTAPTAALLAELLAEVDRQEHDTERNELPIALVDDIRDRWDCVANEISWSDGDVEFQRRKATEATVLAIRFIRMCTAEVSHG